MAEESFLVNSDVHSMCEMHTVDAVKAAVIEAIEASAEALVVLADNGSEVACLSDMIMAIECCHSDVVYDVDARDTRVFSCTASKVGSKRKYGTLVRVIASN